VKHFPRAGRKIPSQPRFAFSGIMSRLQIGGSRSEWPGKTKIQVMSGMSSPFCFVSWFSAEKIVGLHSLGNQFLDYSCAQHITDAIGCVLTIKTFLQLRNGVAKAEAELRRRRLSIQFEKPEFQQALRQKQACKIEIKLAPRLRLETSLLAGTLPALLVQVK